MRSPVRFWALWSLANGVAEAAGLGGVFIAGLLAVEPFGEPEGLGAWLLLAALVVGLAVYEGAWVGVAQWLVLRRELPALAARSWIGATVAGAVVAWVLGMVPSSLASLSDPGGAPPPEPPMGVVMALAAAMGAALGVVLAMPQWWVLRRHRSPAGRWLGANALAWAVAMPAIFWLVGATVAEAQTADSLATLVFGLGAAGLLVGAIHGAFLVRLLLRGRT